MKLQDRFAMVFYCNWLGYDEFHFIDFQLKYADVIILSVGLCGMGVVFAFNVGKEDIL